MHDPRLSVEAQLPAVANRAAQGAKACVLAFNNRKDGTEETRQSGYPAPSMATRMRRLLLVSQRPIDFGGGGSVRWQFLQRELPRHGWEVSVVSARPSRSANEMSNKASVARLAAVRARVMSAAGVVLEPLVRPAGVRPEALAPNNLWALTGRRAVREALDRDRCDVVVATCPPPSAMLAAAGALRGRATPLVIDMRDLWAGNPQLDRGGRILPALERRAFARAGAIVTVTEGLRKQIGETHPDCAAKVSVIPNGFDPALLERRRPRPRTHEQDVTLIHAGSLYGDRSAAALIEALARSRLAGRVRLELVGVIDQESRATARRVGGRVKVALEPPVDWSEAIARTAAADIAVVINTPGVGGATALPGKLYEALALGVPVLALTPPESELARLLERLGQGAGVAPHDDVNMIAAAVERLAAAPPPPTAAELLEPWSRAGGTAAWASLLDRLLAGEPPCPVQERQP